MKRAIGINENLAREILELHTLGVDGGYRQADVTAFAKVLTGWSIGSDQGRFKAGTPGAFLFRENAHEPGSQVIMGERFQQAGFDQGVAVLQKLAHDTSTARFIATKLVRHFVADQPPAAMVDRLAKVFLESGELALGANFSEHTQTVIKRAESLGLQGKFLDQNVFPDEKSVPMIENLVST